MVSKNLLPFFRKILQQYSLRQVRRSVFSFFRSDLFINSFENVIVFRFPDNVHKNIYAFYQCVNIVTYYQSYVTTIDVKNLIFVLWS